MLIGRRQEQQLLISALDSDQSEFIAVYGRRRVGKTFLIREAFNYSFAFQHTGLLDCEFPKKLHQSGFQELILRSRIEERHDLSEASAAPSERLHDLL